MAGNNEVRGVMALMTKYYPCDADETIDEESFRNHMKCLTKKRVHAIGVNCGADFDHTDAERVLLRSWWRRWVGKSPAAWEFPLGTHNLLSKGLKTSKRWALIGSL
jgi:hypothetical protein